MNIVNLQDIKLTHKNPLHSYTLTMRKQKEKLRGKKKRKIKETIPFTIAMKRIKYLGMLLLLLSHFIHVQLCATPSLGFSRQEDWSGLPFPLPMHKSEK